MSEPKLISPMLDGFVMGDPISDHNGVRCCPAMKTDTDSKYIVKIISIPASQVQLDALLLAGAYSDKSSALSYFRQLSEDVIEEAQILQRLSQLEGFLPYEAWQVVEMDDGTGFDVYLLSEYKRTLERDFRKKPMTHLAAMNLGLDLCASLAVCRRSGYLYADLKPSNIYVTADQEYRIGDLGFLKLDSLKYTSLPEKYNSQYTAPEIADAFSSLNSTIDIYAVGLILYQTYNDGLLPFKSEKAPSEAFPAPAYADYEMAEIILKACAPDPTDRWQDPIEMGQALVSYMQRNGANDTPIVPVPIAKELDDAQESVDSESILPEETNEENPLETTMDHKEDRSAEADLSSDNADPENVEDTADISEDAEKNSSVESTIYTEDRYGNLTFLDDASSDETTPYHESADISYGEVSEEVSGMLTQADELILHPTPDPVIPPEPIEIPIPPAPEPEPAPEVTEDQIEEAVANVQNNTSEESSSDDANAPLPAADTFASDNTAGTEKKAKRKKTAKRWICGIFAVLLILALLFVGYYYYKHYYLQPISISLDGKEGTLTVYVNSQIDESKLTVICSDTYGNPLQKPVIDGKAVFTDLAPNSAYTVEIVSEGFHQLVGNTSSAYSTPVQTNIVQFSAITGTENGSVILSFRIDGPDSTQWKVIYSADGEDEHVHSFTGHIVTLTGLTVGSDYTFKLEPDAELYITGTDQITHTASSLIRAENLSITSFSDNKLVTSWTAPENVSVGQWTVRCYNENGYNETLVTTDTTVTFEGISHTDSYTVEVTAEGMSVSERTYIAKNSATVSNFQADTTDPNRLILSWDSNIEISADEWILLYTVNNSDAKEIASSTDNTAEIAPMIPGAVYEFTLAKRDGAIVFNGSFLFTAPEASAFSGYGTSSDEMEFYMCRTPDKENWDRFDLSMSDYVTSFSVGEKASFLVKLPSAHQASDDNIITMFIIRDEAGNIVHTSTQERSWSDMWYRRYCELDIPSLPETAGTYTASIYFNGYLAAQQIFIITAPQ